MPLLLNFLLVELVVQKSYTNVEEILFNGVKSSKCWDWKLQYVFEDIVHFKNHQFTRL